MEPRIKQSDVPQRQKAWAQQKKAQSPSSPAQSGLPGGYGGECAFVLSPDFWDTRQGWLLLSRFGMSDRRSGLLRLDIECVDHARRVPA
ncbi:hypothetical protein IMZ48_08180 [Candidatus Bathyarchaeota archaeon]|nr:hypothetical protein [Candidatus Bathyarchaeota archaeon]